MNTTRPLSITCAIVLLMLMSVLGLITPVLPLVLPLSNKPPFFIQIYGIIVMGIGGVVAVVGLWQLKRWGLVLTRCLAPLSLLVSLSSLWIAASPEGKVASAVIVVLNALVLVLVVLPSTRRAYAAAHTPAAQG